jgi:hypothetical protein
MPVTEADRESYPYKLGVAEQETKQLYELLHKIDHTVSVHGHMDRDTDLHKLIQKALRRCQTMPIQPPKSED